MEKTIVIEPVTRIEGHGRITLHLDEYGQVDDARFHLTQFRGFEKFCEGRPYREMPALTARTCGICPVSHLLASTKACDDLLSVHIPPAAEKLRRVINLAQLLQSHALSYFHLSSPDLLFGWDAPPEQRSIFTMITTHPQQARDGIRLRQIGQMIIESLAGKRIHPAWVVPGGVNAPLTIEKRDVLLQLLPEALRIARHALDKYKALLPQFMADAAYFGDQPTLFLSLVDSEGNLEHYDGFLRIKDATGRIIEDRIPSREYGRLIGEAVEPDSFMKFPYYKPRGYPGGMYRVGPLARLNNCNRCGTRYADVALAEFRSLQEGPDGKPVSSSFHYHFARLVEMIYAVERMERLLNDPDILESRIRARARGNQNEGIGVSEAPRGILMHHYRTDEHGLISWVNLIVATGHNSLAMNQGIRQAAMRFVDTHKLQEGMLNRVEAVIRCFDPCLSCASHALGQMPLRVMLLDHKGQLLDTLIRD